MAGAWRPSIPGTPAPVGLVVSVAEPDDRSRAVAMLRRSARPVLNERVPTAVVSVYGAA
jgi:hypothetical protein